MSLFSGTIKENMRWGKLDVRQIKLLLPVKQPKPMNLFHSRDTYAILILKKVEQMSAVVKSKDYVSPEALLKNPESSNFWMTRYSAVDTQIV